MKTDKTYYSIKEVSKMLDIHEHTIRFWDSKLPNISMRSAKGKTRFFNRKQIEQLSKINDILKNNDSLSLAFQIVSKNNIKNSYLNFNDTKDEFCDHNEDSIKFWQKINKIKNISKKLKTLLN